MQDKVDIDQFDKKFIDESWKSLNARLDQEMPVFKKTGSVTTRILGVLLAASLVLLAILSYLYFEKIPAAPATRYLIQTEKQFIPYYAGFTQSPKAPVKSHNFNPGDRMAVLSGLASSQANGDEQAVTHEWASRPGMFGVENIGPNTLQLAALPMAVQELETEYHSPDPELSQEFTIQNGKKKPGLNFSFSSFISNLDYTGHGLGLGLDIPLRGAWALETGFYLNYISKDYYILPFLERKDPNNFKSLTLPNLRDADTYYSGLKGFKQIVIPAGLVYSLSDKFLLNSGVRFRYTYAETIEQELETKARHKIAGNQTVAETFFNNSNVGLYSGFSYRFTNHFSLRLDAELGLSSIISNQAISDPYFRKFDLNLINLSGSFKF